MPKETDWIDELYREGANALPPEALDREIAHAARERPRWHHHPTRLAGLATAAVVVIAAITLLVPRPPAESPAPTVGAPPPATTSEPARTQDAGRAASKVLEAEIDRSHNRASESARFERTLSTMPDADTVAGVVADEPAPRSADAADALRTTRPAAAPALPVACGAPPFPAHAQYRIDDGDPNLVIVEAAAGAERWRCGSEGWTREPAGRPTSEQQ